MKKLSFALHYRVVLKALSFKYLLLAFFLLNSNMLLAGIYPVSNNNANSVTVSNSIAVLPGINVGNVSGSISACAGTASMSPNIQQFSVTGNGLSKNITVTAPKDFEVSLSVNSGYNKRITLAQSGGIVNNVLIYVRSAASAKAGNISGNIKLTSKKAVSQEVAVTGTIKALLTVNPIHNQTLLNGAVTKPINFTGTASSFAWVNSNPAIGLAATGTGNIPSFTAVNTSSSPVTATITVTPISAAGFAYIADINVDSVQIINTSTNTVIGAVTTGSGPLGVSISPDGTKVYVTNEEAGTLSAISIQTNTVIATINVGSNPYGVVASPDGSKVYVANTNSNNVSVINTTTNTVTATIPADAGPTGIAISPDGNRLYVADVNSSSVSVINTVTNALISTIGVGANSIGVAVSPDGTRVYVANYNSNTVSVINTTTNAVATTITVGTNPTGLAVSPDGSRLYVANFTSNNVSVISTATNAIIGTVIVGSGSQGVSVSRDDSRVYVANESSNTVSVIDASTNTVVATIAVGVHPVAFGNFLTEGTGCSGKPATFTITVKPSNATSVIVKNNGKLSLQDILPNHDIRSLSVSIYPNPSVGNFNLQSKGGSGDKLEITITDILGHVVEKYKTTPGYSLAIGSNLHAGVYLIQIKQGQTYQFHRIFKQ